MFVAQRLVRVRIAHKGLDYVNEFNKKEAAIKFLCHRFVSAHL